MDRNEFELRLLGRTPQEELACSERGLQEAQYDYERACRDLAELEDDQVYNHFYWCEDGGTSYDLYRVVKTTPKTYRVAEVMHDGTIWEGNRTYSLPRAKLDAGEEIVTARSRGWGLKHWVMGWAIRPVLQARVYKACEAKERAERRLVAVRRDLALGRVPLSEDMRQVLDRVRATAKPDWREGF